MKPIKNGIQKILNKCMVKLDKNIYTTPGWKSERKGNYTKPRELFSGLFCELVLVKSLQVQG